MFASASDLISAGVAYHEATIGGTDKKVQFRGMTIAEAERFGKLSQKEPDKLRLSAHLLKMCCPAFRGFWWTPARIRKKLTAKIILELAFKIMEASGHTKGAVDEAVKS